MWSPEFSKVKCNNVTQNKSTTIGKVEETMQQSMFRDVQTHWGKHKHMKPHYNDTFVLSTEFKCHSFAQLG